MTKRSAREPETELRKSVPAPGRDPAEPGDQDRSRDHDGRLGSDDGVASFYDAPTPLPPEAAEDQDAKHAAADLDSFLARLGPPPAWGIPARLRAVLAHAYRSAARRARRLAGQHKTDD